MRKLQVLEISAVTVPAQRGALAMLLKMDNDTLVYGSPSVDEMRRRLEQRHANPPEAHAEVQPDVITPEPITPEPITMTPTSPPSFESAARAIARRDRVPLTVAMSQARAEYGSLYEKLQENAPADERPPRVLPAVAKAERDFKAIARDIGKSRGVSRRDALRSAREEHPEAFSALQQDPLARVG